MKKAGYIQNRQTVYHTDREDSRTGKRDKTGGITMEGREIKEPEDKIIRFPGEEERGRILGFTIKNGSIVRRTWYLKLPRQEEETSEKLWIAGDYDPVMHFQLLLRIMEKLTGSCDFLFRLRAEAMERELLPLGVTIERDEEEAFVLEFFFAKEEDPG